MATQRGSATEVEGSGTFSGDSESMQSSVTRKYQVEFTDSSGVEIEAANASGVPAWGAKLAGYNLYVFEKNAERDAKAPYLWNVTVTYRTLKPNTVQPNLNPTTSTWSVVKSIRSYPTEEPIDKDFSNKPCRNVLGEPFNPPITQVINDQQINITFLSNASTYRSDIANCLDHVNIDGGTITIGGIPHPYAIGELWFKDYTANEFYDVNGTKCMQYAFEILGRPGGDWDVKRANQSVLKSVLSGGTMTLASDGTIKTVHITTNGTTGEDISEPRYLYDASHASLPGQPIPNGGSITLNAFAVKNLSIVGFFSNLLKDVASV